MFRNSRTFLLFAVALVWASVTMAGFASLWRYENTAAAQPEFDSHWPVLSHIPLDANLPTLVVFMHPQCPCSKATVAELARVMTICQGRLIAQCPVHQTERISRRLGANRPVA